MSGNTRFFGPFALLLAVLLSGCGSVQLASFEEPLETPAGDPAATEWITAGDDESEQTIAESEISGSVTTLLAGVLDNWIGVPYKWGGEDKSGVDCSAFVRHVYANALGVTIPRTTVQQKKAGTRVARGGLQPADLVFFFTPKRTNHVGVYLGEGRFAHASTSHGVMVSDLSESYWDNAFIDARRLHDQPLIMPLETRTIDGMPVTESPRIKPGTSTRGKSTRRTGW